MLAERKAIKKQRELDLVQAKDFYDKQLHETEESLRKVEEEYKSSEETLNAKRALLDKALVLMRENIRRMQAKRTHARKESKVESPASFDEVKFLSFKYSANVLSNDLVYSKLTEEIGEFCEWVRLEAVRHKQRREILVNGVQQSINYCLRNAEVKTYGSVATDLCLPSSDIDMVIVPEFLEQGKNGAYILDQLQAQLQTCAWVRDTKLISRTAMPVLRVDCKEESGFTKLDITVNDYKHKGLDCVEWVRRCVVEYPSLKGLLLVFKHILKVADLNDPYSVTFHPGTSRAA